MHQGRLWGPVEGWWGGGEDFLTIKFIINIFTARINKDLWYVSALEDCYSPKYMKHFSVFLFYIPKNLIQVPDLKMPYFMT